MSVYLSIFEVGLGCPLSTRVNEATKTNEKLKWPKIHNSIYKKGIHSIVNALQILAS